MTLVSHPGAAYGWRARIGFLQPAMGNPNHPYEFYLIAPEGVTISVISLRSVEDPATEFLSAESLNEVVRRLPLGVKALLAQGVQVVVQAGIPHLAIQGRSIEDTLRTQVAAITDIPFIIDMRASIEAMQRLQMQRIVMVSPFTDVASAQTADYVGPDGISVVSTYRINVASYGGIYGISLGTVYEQAKRAFLAAGGADGLWLPGAAMPTVATIAALEQDLGVPVVSSKQAMVWAALRAARVPLPATGFGRLMQT